MPDLEFDPQREKVCDQIEKDHPDCAELLRQMAEKMRVNRYEKAQISSQVSREGFTPAIEQGLISILNDEGYFSDRGCFVRFLSDSIISETGFLSLIDDDERLIDAIQALLEEEYKFPYMKGTAAEVLLSLSNKWGKDLVDRVADLATHEEHRLFWEIYYPFFTALPFMEPDCSSLLRLLGNTYELTHRNVAQPDIYDSVQKLVENNPELGEKVVGEIVSNPKTSAVHFLATILRGIARSGAVLGLHAKCLELAAHDDALVAASGILGCSVLEYSNQSAFERTFKSTLAILARFESDTRSEVRIAVAQAYGYLAREWPVGNQKLEELSRANDPSIQFGVSAALHRHRRLFSSEKWYKSCLLNLASVARENMGTIQNIERCLRGYTKSEPHVALSFLEKWVLNHDYERGDDTSITVIFKLLLSQIYDEQPRAVESQITNWFNSDEHRLHKAASNIVTDIFVRKNESLHLSETVLDDLSPDDVVYVIQKIAGYVYVFPCQPLCQLVFSVLKRSEEDENINTAVIEAFVSYIGYNYPSTTKSFLEEQVTNGTELQQRVAKEILEHLVKYKERFGEIDRVREFEPPSLRTREFLILKAMKRPLLLEAASEHSPFLSMLKRIQLKGGKTWFTKHEGKYTEKSPLTDLSWEVEMPLGEVIDPIGQEIQRVQWRRLNRAEENHETHNP